MRTIARSLSLALAAVFVVVGALAAHDMFLRPAQHFVEPNSSVLVRLLNGTFSSSANSISRDRLLDVAIVSPTGRVKLDTAAWSVAGDTSSFTLTTTAPGTYVLGASTRPRVLALPERNSTLISPMTAFRTNSRPASGKDDSRRGRGSAITST